MTRQLLCQYVLALLLAAAGSPQPTAQAAAPPRAARHAPPVEEFQAPPAPPPAPPETPADNLQPVPSKQYSKAGQAVAIRPRRNAGRRADRQPPEPADDDLPELRPAGAADDEARNDEARNDEARNDEARNDEARNDEARNDEARNDEARNDEARDDNADRSDSDAIDPEGHDGDDAARPARQLTPQMIALRQKLMRTLDFYMRKPVYTQRHSPWGIMHAMHSFGVESRLYDGRRWVNATGWLCWNQPCRGRRLMYLRNGQLELREGPGFQGHQGQFLALLAQARVKKEFKLQVDGRSFTIEDLIRHEQATCQPGTELTFKLIGLVHYVGPRATWQNAYGHWDIPRLIDEELRQPVIGAACGGTHRLMGHSYALSRARRHDVPLSGAWKRADDFTLKYQQRAVRLRNRDGSFSTEWFEGRGFSSEVERRLQTSGHILEWLVFSLPTQDLEDARIVRSVDYLATLMWHHRQRDWEIGPLGHALRALALYDQRMFGGEPGKLEARVSQLLGNPAR